MPTNGRGPAKWDAVTAAKGNTAKGNTATASKATAAKGKSAKVKSAKGDSVTAVKAVEAAKGNTVEATDALATDALGTPLNVGDIVKKIDDLNGPNYRISYIEYKDPVENFDAITIRIVRIVDTSIIAQPVETNEYDGERLHPNYVIREDKVDEYKQKQTKINTTLDEYNKTIIKQINKLLSITEEDATKVKELLQNENVKFNDNFYPPENLEIDKKNTQFSVFGVKGKLLKIKSIHRVSHIYVFKYGSTWHIIPIWPNTLEDHSTLFESIQKKSADEKVEILLSWEKNPKLLYDGTITSPPSGGKPKHSRRKPP
jgi:hypothetical protein